MKINISHSSTNPDKGKFVIKQIRELLSEYDMPESNSSLFYFGDGEGTEFFCTWMKETKGLDAKPFKFKDGNTTLAMGFDFVENEALTAELLKQ